MTSSHLTLAGHVETYSDGSFQLADVGNGSTTSPAHLLDVEDWDGRTVIDKLAWSPSRPTRWWRERLEAIVLGYRALHFAEWRDDPLTLYSTPAAWLHASAEGDNTAICILDWSADPRSIFKPGVNVRGTAKLIKRVQQSYWRHVEPQFNLEAFDD